MFVRDFPRKGGDEGGARLESETRLNRRGVMRFFAGGCRAALENYV